VKTQIIRIETHDDIISIKDKMGWGQTPRILLVWPTKGKILNRRLDLVYLKRHSTALGAQLALVSKDSDVRYYAKKLNIPVYSNIRKAEKTHWRRPRRRYKVARETRFIKTGVDKPDLEELRKFVHQKPKSWLVHPITRLFFFTLGVAGILAIASIFVPSAEIKLTPKSRWERVTIPVSANLQTDSTDLSGIVPVQILNVIIEGRGNLPTTGSVTIPDKKSDGKVFFSNMTDRTITIPAGTMVTTVEDPPVRFTTLQAADVAPGSKSQLILVEAVLAGNDGNVLSNHIIAIEGPLGLDLTVTNPIGTSHGSDQTSPAPRNKDYQDLSNKLLTELYNTALEELKSKLAPNDLLLWTDTSEYEILEENFIPSEIQPADFLYLTMRVEYRAYVVTGETLNNLGQSILEANLPEGYLPVRSTLEIKHLQAPTQDEDRIFNWNMDAKWQTNADINKAEAIKMVLWHSPEAAVKKLLSHLPINEDLSITIKPEWWPRLPILPFRVNVTSVQNQDISPVAFEK
jgi:hypothetical protein